MQSLSRLDHNSRFASPVMLLKLYIADLARVYVVFFAILGAAPATAMLPEVSLPELVNSVPLILVGKVTALTDAKWKDEYDVPVKLATIHPMKALKGTAPCDILIAFSPGWSEEPNFREGDTYVFFIYSISPPLVLPFQTRLFGIEKDHVFTSGVVGEPTSQNLEEFIDKIRSAVARRP